MRIFYYSDHINKRSMISKPNIFSSYFPINKLKTKIVESEELDYTNH